MLMFKFCLISIVLKILLINANSDKLSPVHYAWNYVNFTWESRLDYEVALKNKTYVKESIVVSGVRRWKDQLYLTLPRWKHGVTATLTRLPVNRVNGDLSPNLEPYPSWSQQIIGKCGSAFQNAVSMEIDPYGRMWILDTGRTGIFSENPQNACAPRLVVLDLDHGGRTLLNYIFPDDVADPNTAVLDDIVLDHMDGGFAYITDTDNKKPGIIVYSMNQRKSWKVMHASMMAETSAIEFKVNGTSFSLPLNVDGIALTPASNLRDRLVYYSPLSSYKIFTITTHYLKNPKNFRNIDDHIQLLGKKPSQSDGMTMSADGRLFFGLLANDTISSWDTHELQFTNSQKSIFTNHEELRWPDSMTVDAEGFLWFTSDNLQLVIRRELDINNVNFRVFKLFYGFKGYQYYKF